MAEIKKLYRSADDKIIAGVCGGLAEYFNLDATLVRIIFIVLTLASGAGIILYLLLALVIPKAGGGRDLKNNAADLRHQAQHLTDRWCCGDRNRNLWGVLIVFIGLLLLVNGLMPHRLWWSSGRLLWSLAIVGCGLYLIFQHKKIWSTKTKKAPRRAARR